MCRSFPPSSFLFFFFFFFPLQKPDSCKHYNIPTSPPDPAIFPVPANRTPRQAHDDAHAAPIRPGQGRSRMVNGSAEGGGGRGTSPLAQGRTYTHPPGTVSYGSSYKICMVGLTLSCRDHHLGKTRKREKDGRKGKRKIGFPFFLCFFFRFAFFFLLSCCAKLQGNTRLTQDNVTRSEKEGNLPSAGLHQKTKEGPRISGARLVN